MSLVPGPARAAARGGLAPFARGLASAGVSANAVTVAGFLLTVAGTTLLALGQPGAALIVLLVGTLADTLDGEIARASGGGTRLGSFLDSTLDRLSDGAFGVAAAWLGASRGDPLLLWAALVSLVAGIAAWAATGVLSYFAAAVAVVAFLASITTIQRIAHVARSLDT